MIALSAIEDILSAEKAREEAGLDSHLTVKGKAFFERLLHLMREQQLSSVPSDTIFVHKIK